MKNALQMREPSRRSTDAKAEFEALEGRTLLSVGGPGAVEFVYVETNNSQPVQNAVIAFRRNPADGSLQQIGKFNTGGTGFANTTQRLGPDDSDQEVIASSDGRLLFAVNQGSNSIAVFGIRHNGALRRVGTFDSGGVQPVSLGLAGDHLYVTNRGDALQGQTATVAPNYTAFNVDEHGTLSPIAGSTITLPIGLSPSQTLVPRDGRFVFGDNFAIPGTSPSLAQTIDPFVINADGTLQQAPGGAVGAAVSPNVLLGLAAHPTQQIIYGGLTGAGAIAVFTYDKQGSVTFSNSAADQGAGPCWIVVSADGRFLYASNTGTDSIGVFSLADPLHPVQVQEFNLAGPFAPPGVTGRQTASFEFALDPSGKSLYVLTQDTASTRDFQEGNAVHALSVAGNGIVSEANTPLTFGPGDVPADARIQGVAIVARPSDPPEAGGRGRHEESFASALAQSPRSPFGTTVIGDTTVNSGLSLSDIVDVLNGKRHEM